MIADWSRTMEADELGALLDAHGVPRGDIYRAPEMLEDAHFKAREAIVKIAHPMFGSLRMQNTFPRLSETPGKVAACGPDLGQHNGEVFGTLLGLDERARADLAAKGVIGAGTKAAA
jgi:formyl-CoA transferase